MPTRRYSLVFLSTTLLVTLIEQSSNAITLRQSPTVFDYIAPSYFPGVGQGVTYLRAVDPSNPFSRTGVRPFVSLIQLGGTPGLLADLQIYRNEGWNFSKGRDLKGSFNVRRQYACGSFTACGAGVGLGIGFGGIGSALLLNYVPSTSQRNPDPRPGVNNLYWIQRVVTNYPPNQPGVSRSYIDNLNLFGNNATHPYFGSGLPLDRNGSFRDRPYRPNQGSNLFRDYYWTAELYLAEADTANPQMVTIYNGVRWGWQYRFIPDRNPILIPRPAPFPIPRPIPIPIVSPIPTPTPPTCSGGSGGGGCATNFTARTADWDVAHLSSEDVDAASISNDAFEESEVANSIKDTLTPSSGSEYFNFFEDLEQGFFDSNEND